MREHHALLVKVTASGPHQLYLVRPTLEQLQERLTWYAAGGWVVVRVWSA